MTQWQLFIVMVVISYMFGTKRTRINNYLAKKDESADDRTAHVIGTLIELGIWLFLYYLTAGYILPYVDKLLERL